MTCIFSPLPILDTFNTANNEIEVLTLSFVKPVYCVPGTLRGEGNKNCVCTSDYIFALKEVRSRYV